jgi:hypothetical protein
MWSLSIRFAGSWLMTVAPSHPNRRLPGPSPMDRHGRAPPGDLERGPSRNAIPRCRPRLPRSRFGSEAPRERRRGPALPEYLTNSVERLHALPGPCRFPAPRRPVDELSKRRRAGPTSGFLPGGRCPAPVFPIDLPSPVRSADRQGHDLRRRNPRSSSLAGAPASPLPSRSGPECRAPGPPRTPGQTSCQGASGMCRSPKIDIHGIGFVIFRTDHDNIGVSIFNSFVPSGGADGLGQFSPDSIARLSDSTR